MDFIKQKPYPEEIVINNIEDMPEQMKEIFRKIGYGYLPEWTDRGCTMFVRHNRSTIETTRGAVYYIRLELYEVAGCPLIRLLTTIFDRPDDPLVMECFLNIQSEHQQPIIYALTEQETITFHWYDEEFKYVRSNIVKWSAKNREDAKEIIKMAQEIIERTGGGDFDTAKEIFVASTPL